MVKKIGRAKGGAGKAGLELFPIGIELPEVLLASDGSISVRAHSVRAAMSAALKLHRQQRRRISVSYDYR